MWTYNSTYNKWSSTDDKLIKSDFDFLKQELKATRFYAKSLSGATYLPINGTDDVYDILGKYQPRNWYISVAGSPYSITTIPSQHATPIDIDTSYNYYTKYLSEYGLTLKNLFTPNRLIKDSMGNYNYVDVATTDLLDLSISDINLTIDGVRLINGQKVLVKNQISNITLLNTINPNTYFTGNYIIIQDLGGTVEYEYYNEENGIYKYSNGSLVRDVDLDDYKRCIRYSVSVKLGTNNKGKQFHLSRLLDGYYPTTSLNQPIEFKEKHNWILRNRVDYNNLFEINYYDVIKHGTQSYSFDAVIYNIPTRTISVGEFGVILNTQEGKSNIIPNKYKVNLRGISETTNYYWICGDENTVLKVRKHDFNIERILTENVPSLQPLIVKTNLKSISFFNDLRGVVVGELNTILYTKNGGYKWERIELDDFNTFNYNKVLYTTNSSFFIAGNVGVLIEMVETIGGWTAYKRRVSRKIDEDDEYLLVDNINDLYKTTISTWGLSYSYSTQSIPTDKELLFLACNNNIISAYDINNSFSAVGTDFIYFDFGADYGDIKNITRRKETNYFYFTGTDKISGEDGVFSFNISSFNYLGIGNSYSNTTISSIPATSEYSNIYPNEIFDYNGDELLICGNTSLLKLSGYSPINFTTLDSTFEDKLKSKLLVLDYDIASKLNFFTDAGEYRLPNSLNFNSDNITTTGSYIGFKPIEHALTTTNTGTYSEKNWIEYWRDREKTFEFYNNNPLSDSSKVLISTTFSHVFYGSSFSFVGSNITGSASQLVKLAPKILDKNSSRYNGYGLTAISAPTSNHNIFLYDYLMVVRLLSSTFSANVGDVMKLESVVVDGEFVINKIRTFGSYKYAYMFTDFNQNIITDLQSTTHSVTLTNLNKYTTSDELKSRFNQHPISTGYKLDTVNYVPTSSTKWTWGMPNISGNIFSTLGVGFNYTAVGGNLLININCLSNSGTNYSSDFATLPVNTLWKFSDVSGNYIYYTQTSLGSNLPISYYEFPLIYVSGTPWIPLVGDLISVEAIGLGGYLGSSLFEISARFNSDTSYYNLQTSFNTGSVLPIVNQGFTYSFSGGVSASSVITSLTYSFSGGFSSSNVPVVIAGKGTIGFSGDGGPAPDAELDRPMGLAYDMNGNLYITDTNNGRLRMVDLSTTINTISGNNPGSYGPDSVFAFSSDLYEPSDVAIDNINRIYISTISGSGSAPYNVVRRIDVSGTIDVYAGTPGIGGAYGGNGVPASMSKLNSPQAICIDNNNNILYICDTYNNKVRKVDLIADIITDFAGTGLIGFGGDGGLALGARLNLPTGITVDSIGDVYIADSGNNRIRKVSFLSGRISTVAGNGAPGYGGDGMPAVLTRLNNPTGVAVDMAGNMYIADKDNNRIRLVKPNGIISTFTLTPGIEKPNKVIITPTQDIAYSTSFSDLGGSVYFLEKPEVSATLSGQLTFLPVDGDISTLELDGVPYVYTFRNSPSLPGDIQTSTTINNVLNNLLTGITPSLSSSSVLGDFINLEAASGYGSTPNGNSNWFLNFYSIVTTPETLATLSGSMSFLPLDGDTSILTLNGTSSTYTFRDTPSLSNEIQIVGTINGCLNKLILGITSSAISTYLLSTSVTSTSFNLISASGYGSIPNSTIATLNPSWSLSLSSTTGGAFAEVSNDMVYTSGFLKFGYSPTYNLMDYLTSINNIGDPNPTFYASKEYLAMPEYRGIPFGSLTSSTAYIDTNGMTYSGGAMSMNGNKILLGDDLKLEWDSVFINTFVDVNIYGSATYSTTKLLVLNKYYDFNNSAYAIEFHKRLNFTLGDANILSGGSLDIISRRHLYQISEDLQYLNNIQRSEGKITEVYQGLTYSNYENELNFKIPTDSYARILLSDAETIQSLSSIIYVDDKNELALNITKLSKEYIVPISNTSNFAGKLYISCSEKHDLFTGDSAVLEFNGGSQSSQTLNQQYFGYHVITKITDFDFVTDIDYGSSVLVGNDIGSVKYIKQDPFFNYQPVDIIDYGVDLKGEQSIELSVENIKLSGTKYSLIDVDYEKYRFRLIDGLNFETLNLSYQWLLEAEISGAVIGLDGADIVWYKGTWESGRWFGGTWQSGVWMSGDWYGGVWNSNITTDKILSVKVDTKTNDKEQSLWFDGRWYDGTWNNGTWNNGRWYGGTWNNGMWNKGIWNDGTWNNGLFEGGIWVLGTWNSGTFNTNSEPAYWLDGQWKGGDFENGMWYNGNWEQKNGLSRFGTNAFNSRTATWHGGKWISGSFYSKLLTDINGNPDVSETHKYSIWKTGQWSSGEWYGGIAYNMDFKTGTWYGGILEDIQIVGIDTTENTFILNGIFKFNLGDTITIINNQVNNIYSVFGSNSSPSKYIILKQDEDIVNERTIIYVNRNLSAIGSAVASPVNTGLRVVSRFKNLNWKSGIWTNGIFENGLWEGGIWYNGIFEATWS
jgi:sugar lactone lactonase YvrE